MKIKKILAVVLSLCMIFALAACSSSTENEEASTEEAGSSTSSEGTIKIGGIGPLTGDVAQYGVAVKLGAELAVAEINAAGGINGYQIEFKMEDDVGDAEKAVTAYGSLKDWGMQMVMGTVTSTPCISVASEAAADNMLLLTPSGSAVECLEAGDTLFRMCFSDPNQGIGAADFIADNDLATTVAIIYNSSDTYSTGIMEKFTEEAAEVGLEIVATEAFTNDSATDFSAQLTNIKETGADLLFLPIYYTPASLIISQATAMGYEPTYFGSDGMDGILGMENIDADLIDGVMYLTPFIESSTDDATVNFVESFTAAYPDQTAYMNQFAADAYDAIYALKAAAESCGITPDMDASTVGDLMKVAMTEITIDGVTGTGITWGEDGEPNKTPRVAKIEDGSIVAA